MLVRSDLYGSLLEVCLVKGDMIDGDARPSKQVTTIGKSILFTIHNPLDTCLDDQFGTLDARLTA